MLWSPSKDLVEKANLTHYLQWLAANKKLSFKDYHQLWKWSVDNLEEFWESLWQYFDIIHDGEYHAVATDQKTFNMSWFEGVKLNYAEHVFRNSTDAHPAIVFKSESSNISEISWETLEMRAASLQHYFKTWKISEGDRIVAFLPCIPEATIAMLATVSLGAVWSSCSPDFGTSAVLDRFAQTNPKVLIATDRYSYGGKSYDKTNVIQDLIKGLPTLEHIILISENSIHEWNKPVISWQSVTDDKERELQMVHVPFSHP